MVNTISKTNNDEVSVAYRILKAAGHPLYYRDLIDQVFAEKGGAGRPPAHVIAEIHTRINLDSRFVHTGKSTWGLTEWSPQRISARDVEDTAAARQDNTIRREKLLAAIQQDFESDDAGSASEAAGLIDDDSDIDEEDEDEEELETN